VSQVVVGFLVVVIVLSFAASVPKATSDS
jgi:hypothetical protein